MFRIIIVAVFLLMSKFVAADDQRIILQSTTSAQHSGLYDYLIPLIAKDTGIKVHVVAVGTGQAISNAKNCDGDLLLVHSKKDEDQFVKDGYGLYREDLMYNDYVLIGPSDDPVGVSASETIDAALLKFLDQDAIFVSRGDDSGTYKAELRLWDRIDVDPHHLRQYRETGSGMGATITVAVELNGYTLSDRSTWLAYGNKKQHEIVFQGDPPLFNQYGIIPVSPDQCPDTKLAAAVRVTEWLLSEKGQAMIASYQVAGQQLFYPNAR
jgi:tungstate transport system substrate-binding protein